MVGATNQLGRDVFLARQPIYDDLMQVQAYELLFRRGDCANAGDVSLADSASALMNVVVELGLEHLVGSRQAFVNIPHELLVSDCLQVLPPNRVVIELLETIEPTPEVIEAVKKLKAQGYTIALDDYIFEGDLDELIGLADIIKVDLLGVQMEFLPHKVSELRRRGKKVLAEKVESYEMYRQCKAMGFQLFQGYFFAKPELMRGKGSPASLAAMKLVAKLQDPDASISELEALIQSDITLTFRLLKLARSAIIGAGSAVDSLSQALSYLGMRRTMALLSLVAMSGVTEKPNELLVTAMVRARICELLAKASSVGSSEKFFTVGLLSVLDALLDSSMESILTELPLAKDINDALLGQDGELPLVKALHCAQSIEKGNWDEIAFDEVGFSEIGHAYVEAVRWAHEVNVVLAA